jgi:hypothetical protein
MTRLELPNGQFLDIKDKLKVRDTRDVHTYSVDGVSSDGATYRFNIVKYQIAQAAVKITGWSVTDEQGRVVPWFATDTFKARIATLENLDADTFEMIVAALTAHDHATEAAVVAEKNAISDGGTV